MRWSKWLFRALPMPIALRLQYLKNHKRLPNLKAPSTFTEKVVASRLNGDDPLIPRMIDKVLVKEFVADVLGANWVTPTVFSGPSLPIKRPPEWGSNFVVKSTFGTGHVEFVTPDTDWDRVRTISADWIAKGQRWPFTHWPYTAMQWRLLVEQRIAPENSDVPVDFKFFVFGGRAEFVQVDVNRFSGHLRSFHNREWERLNFRTKYAPTGPVPRPQFLDEMLAGVELLAGDFPFVRVDLYETASGPRFGEMTFFPEGGMLPFSPASMDADFGGLWPVARQTNRIS